MIKNLQEMRSIQIRALINWIRSAWFDSNRPDANLKRCVLNWRWKIVQFDRHRCNHFPYKKKKKKNHLCRCNQKLCRRECNNLLACESRSLIFFFVAGSTDEWAGNPGEMSGSFRLCLSQKLLNDYQMDCGDPCAISGALQQFFANL